MNNVATNGVKTPNILYCYIPVLKDGVINMCKNSGIIETYPDVYVGVGHLTNGIYAN